MSAAAAWPDEGIWVRRPDDGWQRTVVPPGVPLWGLAAAEARAVLAGAPLPRARFGFLWHDVMKGATRVGRILAVTPDATPDFWIDREPWRYLRADAAAHPVVASTRLALGWWFGFASGAVFRTDGTPRRPADGILYFTLRQATP